MAITGIIGAMGCEVEMFHGLINDIQTREIAGINFASGHIGNCSVVVACSGVGKVNAAACAQIMIDRFEVSQVINTGVAGALAEYLDVGQVVIADDLTYHDVRPLQMESLFPYALSFPCDPGLVQRAQKACRETGVTNWRTGRIVSGESFIEDPAVKERIFSTYGALCVEMEGAAIAHVAYINKVPFIVIRSISDKADNDATVSFAEFSRQAAAVSARLVLAMLS